MLPFSGVPGLSQVAACKTCGIASREMVNKTPSSDAPGALEKRLRVDSENTNKRDLTRLLTLDRSMRPSVELTKYAGESRPEYSEVPLARHNFRFAPKRVAHA